MRLRRNKRDEAPAAEGASASSQAAPDPGSGSPEGAGGAVLVGETAVVAPGPAPASPPVAAGWEPPAPTPGNHNGGGSLPSGSGPGGLFNRMYGDVGEQSADERARQAAYEFQQMLAPAMDLLQASVPDASSPEEAGRILEQSQGELVPDPKGGAYVDGDAFNTDARIYYRLLRRDYEKAPRPSEQGRRQTSHHLHSVYGKLGGNKGW